MVLVSMLLLAAPAMGADWEFSGSQRMATLWNHYDFGDFRVNDGFQPGQIRLELGDFQLVAITAYDGGVEAPGSDPYKYLPKFEAACIGKLGDFWFTPSAGFQ
jgi:hypothetical protein